MIFDSLGKTSLILCLGCSLLTFGLQDYSLWSRFWTPSWRPLWYWCPRTWTDSHWMLLVSYALHPVDSLLYEFSGATIVWANSLINPLSYTSMHILSAEEPLPIHWLNQWTEVREPIILPQKHRLSPITHTTNLTQQDWNPTSSQEMSIIHLSDCFRRNRYVRTGLCVYV